MGNCRTPVRTTCIGAHAFGLGGRGEVATHLLNSWITSLGATYPQLTTMKSSPHSGGAGMSVVDAPSKDVRIEEANGLHRSYASPSVKPLFA